MLNYSAELCSCSGSVAIGMPSCGTSLMLAQGWHKKTLQGRFVLQIDELSNIATHIRDRSAS